MRFLKNIISPIAETDQLSLALKTFFLVAIIFMSKLNWMGFGVAFPFAFLFFFLFLSDQNFFRNKWLWFSIFVMLLIKIINDIYGPANHHYLLMFACLLIFHTLFQAPEKQEAFLRENAKIITVLVLFFVSLQKFCSTPYMNGDFFSYFLMRGEFFVPIPILHPEYAEWVKVNAQLIKEVRALNPYEQNCMDISVGNESLFKWIGKGLSYFVLIMETLTMLIILLVRNKKIVHYSLIGLIIGILLARPECGFLSVLSALGLAQCSAELKNIRVIYIFLITLFSALILLSLVYY